MNIFLNHTHMHINTLQDLILKQSENFEQGITIINSSTDETFISYEELNKNAISILGYFQEIGLKEGDELIFQLKHPRHFIEIFWACILGKIIPVPLNIAYTGELVNKLINVIDCLISPYLITDENEIEFLLHNETLKERIERKILKVNNFKKGITGHISHANKEDIAYIQFSSGSTGSPKGVVLTHENLLTNIDSIQNGLCSPITGDLFFSWMPLTHDMGLIGFHLTPTAAGWNHFIMSTELFIRNPSLWLSKISQHKITFTSSPNFGYQYLLKHFKAEKNQNINLSSLRLIGNGAEPISIDICNRFYDYFKKYGLKENVIFPVYGLAEACLAVAFSKPGDVIRWVEVDRNSLNIGDCILAPKDEKSSIKFVCVGEEVKNTSICIVDLHQNKLKNGHVGIIQIKGLNVTKGYYRNSIANKSLIGTDGWLNTGDLGFKDQNGKLYIVGRYKDIIFVNGSNYYSPDLERIAENVPGIELGKNLISADYNEKLSRDEIVAFVQFRGKLESFLPLKMQLQATMNDEVGIILDEIVPVKSIPKTTSGKVQRYKLLKEYQNGSFDKVLYDLKKIEADKQVVNFSPLNGKEEKILEYCKGLLKKETICSDDNFFKIGGDSLKANKLVWFLREQMNMEASLQDIYIKKNISAFSKFPSINNEIVKGDINAYRSSSFPLSHAQQGIFYYYHLNKKSLAYNIPHAFIINANINVEKIKLALHNIITRYDILRTTFHLNGDGAFQKVNPTVIFSLEKMVLNGWVDLDKHLMDYVQPFDLDKQPLMRLKYGTIDKNSNILMFDFNHIVTDGISVIKIIEDFFDCLNEKNEIVQYHEHVKNEGLFLKSEEVKCLERFWYDKFKDDVPALNLPYDFNITSNISDEGEKYHSKLGPGINHSLEKLTEKTGITKGVILFTCYVILLKKLSNQDDIVIGVAESGRNYCDENCSVGMFTNNLPVRILSSEYTTFLHYLNEINKNFIEAYNNKKLPYNRILELIDKPFERGSLFETMFVFQNMEIPELHYENCKVNNYFIDTKTSKFNLTLEIFDNENLEYNFEYSTHLFKKESVVRFSEYFCQIINLMITDYNVLVKDIDILTLNEKDKLIRKFNRTSSLYSNSPIHEIFEQQVYRIPNAVAIYSDGKSLTYSELNKKADNVASVLISKGLTIEDKVVVVMDQSVEFIISILAILKAGGAYIPIDINYPIERIEYILKDCKAEILLTKSTFRNLISDHTSEIQKMSIINVDDAQNQDICYERVKVLPDNLAYVIYTSGSTGYPKGVMIEHRNLANYICWAAELYVKSQQVDFAFFTSIGFDLTITSIYTPLITGNSIIIYQGENQHELIENLINDDKAGIIKLTPSHLKLIINDHKINIKNSINLKRFIVGGEDLNAELAKKIYLKFNRQVEIYNEYGPTETTVGCMIYKFDIEEKYVKSIPIGRPVSNVLIYVLDPNFKPVPPNVTGEIYVSGAGVGRGYMNKVELTDQKFVYLPELGKGKFYKTGDIGKFIDEESILFLGRKDEQVKINGYRIELGEIEECVRKYDGIVDAVVIKYDIEDSSRLCCFYVGEIDKQLLDRFLRLKLPYYMLPSVYTQLEEIPITNNGKVDKSLLASSEVKPGVNKRNQETDIQKVLLKIFREVLKNENLGIDDNFYQFGGDSIKAVQISAKLYDIELNINAKDIMQYQTIDKISDLVDKVLVEYNQGIIKGEKSLSPIENWFFLQGFKDINFYNQSVLLEFKKPVNENLLVEIFEKLIIHHDGLRLNFNTKNNCMYFNESHIKQPFIIEKYNIKYKDELPIIGKQLKSSFDITKSLLLKAAIITQEGANDNLLIIAHHLVIDGVSWRILLDDIYLLYKEAICGNEIKINKKTASIYDWQLALEKYSTSKELKNQLDYWKNINYFKLYRNDILNYKFEKSVFEIDKDITDYLLNKANMNYNTDIQILLIVLILKTLKELTGLDKLTMELESHGHDMDSIDLSRTIGWLTTIYPVDFWIKDDVGDLIKHAKEQLRNVPDNGIGYGILKYMTRNIDINNSADIRFNYLGRFEDEVSNDLFEYSNMFSGEDRNIEKIKFEVNCMILHSKLHFEINYHKSLFNEITKKELKDYIVDNLNDLIFYLKSVNDICFTPSDFKDADLNEDDINLLFDN